MGKYRFVDPELERLPLSDGDWIDVDKEVNFKDSIVLERLFNAGENVKALTILIRGWSFTDRDGKTVLSINEDTIANLHTDTVLEITSAIGEHRKRMAEEKKAPKRDTKLEALSR